MIKLLIEYYFLPINIYININGVIIHKELNSNGTYGLYAFPDGYFSLNKKNIFPLKTSVFQLSLCQNFNNHNKNYNNKIQTQVRIIFDEQGKKIKNGGKSFTAYYANTTNFALQQIIYILHFFYNSFERNDFYQNENSDWLKINEENNFFYDENLPFFNLNKNLLNLISFFKK